MSCLNKFLFVIYSFFQSAGIKEKKFKFIKYSDDDVFKFNCIWQVVEYDKYSSIRNKNICGDDVSVGLKYTLDFFENLDSCLKVLIINTDDFDGYSVDHTSSPFDIILLMENIGLDLGAQKSSLSVLKYIYSKYENIPMILSNSSFVPKSVLNISKLLDRDLVSNVLASCSYAYGPRYFIRKPFHLQSFFLVSNFKNFDSIFSSLELSNNNKFYIIRNGEIKISSIAINLGLKLLVYDGIRFHIFTEIIKQFFAFDYRSTKSTSHRNSL
jgi:hypothetical protein